MALSHSAQFLFYGCNIFLLLGGRLLQFFAMLHASPSPGPLPKFLPWPWASGWAFQSLSCSPAVTVNSGHEARPLSWWDSWDPVGICSSYSWYLCAHLLGKKTAILLFFFLKRNRVMRENFKCMIALLHLILKLLQNCRNKNKNFFNSHNLRGKRSGKGIFKTLTVFANSYLKTPYLKSFH